MARRPGSRWQRVPAVCKASALCLAMLAGQAHAETGADAGGTTQLIDRDRIRTAVALEASAQAGEGVPLILAVEVNGMDHGLAQFRLIGDELWATRRVLGELGLALGTGEGGAEDLLAVAEALDAEVTYLPALQAVSVMVDTSRLAVGTTRLNFNEQDQPVAASATGLLVNYDLAGNYAGDRLSLDGFTETRLFSGTALLENTALFRLGGRGGTQGGGDEVLRLDTTVSYSLPDQRLTLRAGDIISRATSWSRATRLGGLRIGTDFALQPYLITAPLPSFYGDAALPSTVDLYIDGLKRFSGSVTPGPFEIGSGVNQINGAGTAQLVVTDALGQVTTLDYPIYDTPALLRSGLTDWSVELGAVRQDYGLRSFAYGKAPVASASLRHGISNALTIEAHAEGGDGLVNGGAGAAVLLPFGGVVTGSAAASRRDGETGLRWEAGYSWTDSSFNLAATVQRASNGYRDIAAADGALVPQARDVVSVGYNSAALGTFGASLVRQADFAEPTRSFVALNWYRTLGERFSLSLTAQQDFAERKDRGAFLSLTFVPRSRDQVSAGLKAASGRTSASLGYRRSLPYEGGTGFAADTVYDGDRVHAAAQVDHLGRVGQATGGVRLAGERVSAYAGWSGAVVAMSDGVFASRKVFDGFAVVSTSGVGDVPVLLQNRQIGRTDGRGKLLVTGLNSHQANLVSIDASDLPPTLWVEGIEQQAVPAQRSGAVVDFAIHPIRSVLVTLVDEAGSELAVGLRGWMEGDASQPLMLGFGGQLFIERAQAGARVVIERADGPCSIRLPDQLPSDNAGLLGKMTCELL